MKQKQKINQIQNLKKWYKDAQETENQLEEIMTENLPNLVKEKDIQVQEVQRVSDKMNPKRPTQRHIIIKMAKFKEKERT